MQQTLRTAALLSLALATPSAAGCRVLGSVDVAVIAWEADLVGALGAPSGSVAALSQGDEVRASIRIQDGPQQAAVYDWRIRRGSCSSPGPVIGGLAQYPSLDHEPPGSTSVDTRLREAMPDGRSYHAVLSRAADGQEVACGQFPRV